MTDSASTLSHNASTDPLDRLLSSSLANRPELTPISNLAQRAIQRAQRLDRLAAEHRSSLMIQRWRLRFVCSAAALLMGALILFGGKRLLAESQSLIGSSDSSSASIDSSVISTNDSGNSATSEYVLWLGGLFFVCTLAGLAAQSAIVSERPPLLI